MAAKQLRITFHDGTTVDVQPNLEDRLKFETALRRNKGWGKLADNALKLQPFLAWSAATREGKTDLSWDEFTGSATAALDVESVPEPDEDDASDLEVDGLGEGTRTTDSTTSPSSSTAATKSRRGSGAVKTDRA